ncbi:peptidoglycan bridge formation glycyltransferase FemA/FemB family protein [Candidatus Gracilibacteria bacterium]|nr:peptidoglycan bridge formation glycyltransferase FemA/FemB family protein [Candidatus Gracilibacteria bacterium]
MSFEFFEYKAEHQKQWDDFVLTSSFGSVHQTADWKSFQEKIPGRERVLGFGIRESSSNKILATVFCVKMNTGFFGKYWWYSARGPVFDPEKHLEAGLYLMKEVVKKLKKEGGIFWRFDPYFSQESSVLLKQGELRFLKTTQNYQPEDTLEIDLSKTEEIILSEMKRKGRYNIKLAQKKGVKIVKIEDGKFSNQDLEDFYQLNQETTSRDKFSGHQKIYYKNFLQELKKYAVLFFAEVEGKRIATAITTFCGEQAIYYFGASTSDPACRNLMAPYLLQWEMIREAKERGMKKYDFLGIAPADEENVYRKDHEYAGITEFKLKFGGNRKNYASGNEFVLSPFWYSAYRFVKKIK